jgi:hypothetical protein
VEESAQVVFLNQFVIAMGRVLARNQTTQLSR